MIKNKSHFKIRVFYLRASKQHLQHERQMRELERQEMAEALEGLSSEHELEKALSEVLAKSVEEAPVHEPTLRFLPPKLRSDSALPFLWLGQAQAHLQKEIHPKKCFDRHANQFPVHLQQQHPILRQTPKALLQTPSPSPSPSLECHHGLQPNEARRDGFSAHQRSQGNRTFCPHPLFSNLFHVETIIFSLV